MKREELTGALCGTAPEVLSRTFRRLASEGVVQVSGPIATIVDPAALAARARVGRKIPDPMA